MFAFRIAMTRLNTASAATAGSSSSKILMTDHPLSRKYTVGISVARLIRFKLGDPRLAVPPGPLMRPTKRAAERLVSAG